MRVIERSLEDLTPYRGNPRQNADAVAAVLPLHLLSGLLDMAGDKMVLWSVTRRVDAGRVRTLPDGRTEREFSYVHLYWEQALCLRVETRRL